MYCSNCGKPIESGTKCYDCLKATYNPTPKKYIRPKYNFEPDPDNAMYGFFKALVSTILAVMAGVWTYIVADHISSSTVEQYGKVYVMLDPNSTFISLLVPIPFIIVSIIFGIISIRTFARRRVTCEKPVVTLVLGIVGICISALSLCFVIPVINQVVQFV